jgi:NADH-quinone oxidoreductase subunit A
MQEVSEFFSSYLSIFYVGLAAIAMAGGTLLVGRLIRPKVARLEKAIPYESGVDSSPGDWSQSHARYYLYALLFLIFDIEVAFIAPWAVQVESLGWFGLIEMLIFVAILALGLLYAWRKGVFSWDS